MINVLPRIPVYTTMLYLGAVSGILVGTQWARIHGLTPSTVSAAMVLLLFPALVGARLLFVALHPNFFRGRRQEMFRRSQAGAAMYGGLILAIPVSVPLLAILRIDFWRFWDAGAVAMLIGMVFTKFGCFMNGCCAGRPARRIGTSEPIGLASGMSDRMMEIVRLRRFPSQFLEAGLAIIVLFLSMQVASTPRAGGAMFLSALAAYGAGRYFLESARETVDRVLGISVNRAISACVAVLATAVFLLSY